MNHRQRVETIGTVPKPGGVVSLGSVHGEPVACVGGTRHGGGVTLDRALVWNVGTFAPRARQGEGALRCVAAEKMKAGPSESACRCRLQTTSSCCGPKAMVVSVEETAPERRQVRVRKVSAELTSVSVENVHGGCQNWGLGSAPGGTQEDPVYCLSGTRRTAGTSLTWASPQDVGTLHGMLRENPISVDHEGGKYRCPCRGRIIP